MQRLVTASPVGTRGLSMQITTSSRDANNDNAGTSVHRREFLGFDGDEEAGGAASDASEGKERVKVVKKKTAARPRVTVEKKRRPAAVAVASAAGKKVTNVETVDNRARKTVILKRKKQVAARPPPPPPPPPKLEVTILRRKKEESDDENEEASVDQEKEENDGEGDSDVDYKPGKVSVHRKSESDEEAQDEGDGDGDGDGDGRDGASGGEEAVNSDADNHDDDDHHVKASRTRRSSVVSRPSSKKEEPATLAKKTRERSPTKLLAETSHVKKAKVISTKRKARAVSPEKGHEEDARKSARAQLTATPKKARTALRSRSRERVRSRSRTPPRRRSRARSRSSSPTPVQRRSRQTMGPEGKRERALHFDKGDTKDEKKISASQCEPSSSFMDSSSKQKTETIRNAQVIYDRRILMPEDHVVGLEGFNEMPSPSDIMRLIEFLGDALVISMPRSSGGGVTRSANGRQRKNLVHIQFKNSWDARNCAATLNGILHAGARLDCFTLGRRSKGKRTPHDDFETWKARWEELANTKTTGATLAVLDDDKRKRSGRTQDDVISRSRHSGTHLDQSEAVRPATSGIGRPEPSEALRPNRGDALRGRKEEKEEESVKEEEEEEESVKESVKEGAGTDSKGVAPTGEHEEEGLLELLGVQDWSQYPSSDGGGEAADFKTSASNSPVKADGGERRDRKEEGEEPSVHSLLDALPACLQPPGMFASDVSSQTRSAEHVMPNGGYDAATYGRHNNTSASMLQRRGVGGGGYHSHTSRRAATSFGSTGTGHSGAEGAASASYSGTTGATEHMSGAPPSHHDSRVHSRYPTSGKAMCRFYRSARGCNFGDRCRFSHV